MDQVLMISAPGGSIRRCGRRFEKTPQPYHLSDFTEDELEILKKEHRLSIRPAEAEDEPESETGKDDASGGETEAEFKEGENASPPENAQAGAGASATPAETGASTSSKPEGEGGTEDTDADQKDHKAFIDAVAKLDPKNPDDFTKDMRPDVNALAALGFKISAKDRDEIWKGLDEETRKALTTSKEPPATTE
ncbi:MAG: hypothetical protein ACPGOV_11855 [Magnetovibrionaceae bacterium]